MRDETLRYVANMRVKAAQTKGGQYDWRKDPVAYSKVMSLLQATNSKFNIGENAVFGPEALDAYIESKTKDIAGIPLPQGMQRPETSSVSVSGPAGVLAPQGGGGDGNIRQEMSANAAKKGVNMTPEQWTPEQIKAYLAKKGK